MAVTGLAAEHLSSGGAALIAAHASAASLALILGAVNLRRAPKGDRAHRRIGRIWVLCMYWTVGSSFAIKRLHPSHFSWIHLLSIFTFVTLTIGMWAAVTGRVEMHREYMTGSYFGLLGAFAGAVAVPVRAIPQLAARHLPVFVAATSAICVVAAVIVRTALGRSRRSGRGTAGTVSATTGVSRR